MVTTVSSKYCKNLDYSFLLLTHIICADQQIHVQESRALRELAQQVRVDELTLQEMEKILGQEDTQISLETAAQNVPLSQRTESLRQLLAIAYVDGYFSPLERQVIDQVARMWGVPGHEIDQMLKTAQGLQQSYIRGNSHGEPDKNHLSIGAKLLKGAESVLSKFLITQLTELAPGAVGEKIERLQREILLSGPEYDQAIQQCATIAKADFGYADKALKATSLSLRNLGKGLQQGMYTFQQKAVGQGNAQSVKNVAQQLEQTRKNFLSEILEDLESVQAALQAKQRSLGHFSVAFMGRTKVGKSTLHAVITKEGWEAIGVGKQRTTRYNRVYEWNNIRIIDTPGIGAPGGKTDEEIARNIIEEADVICYVVTDDSIQEAEFEFLKILKEKTKPLIILLNIQYNLRDSRRLEHFLKNPERWFAQEGRSGIGGHLNRIRRYAQQHYANDYLPVVPVMLLAAQLAQEPDHGHRAQPLFKASRIQDFLDSIRVSLIDYGAIRRSQTLLGSTVGAIHKPQQWIGRQAKTYQELAQDLQEKRQQLAKQLQQAHNDQQATLEQSLREIFQSAFDQVTPFAETYWKAGKRKLQRKWKEVLEDLEFEERLQLVAKDTSQDLQAQVQTALEEIGNELQIIHRLHHSNFHFSAQDSSVIDQDFMRITGMALVAAGAMLAFVFPPLGLLSLVGGIVSWVGGWFESRSDKRRKAVNKISEALYQQLDQEQDRIIPQVKDNFEKYYQSVATSVDGYFAGLIDGIGAIATQLHTTQHELNRAANGLNRAYGKRIIDWATDQPETLTDQTIHQIIHSVSRDFGRNLEIQTTQPVLLTKSQDEICRILQEDVSISPVNP